MAHPISMQHSLMLCLFLLLPACADPGRQKQPPLLLAATELYIGKDISDSVTKKERFLGNKWWRVFRDPTLDRLIDAALQEPPTLAIAQARIDQAEAKAGVAYANTRPSLSGMMQVLRSQDSENYRTSAAESGTWHTDGQSLLQARYNLDLWGLNRALSEAAMGSVRAAQAEESVAKLALTGSLVETYFALGGANAEQAIVARNLEQRRSILALSEGRLKSGLGTQVDVVRARSPIPLLEADQARLIGVIRGYQQRLAVLAGKGPGWGEQWAPRLSKESLVVSLPSQLPAELLGGRPDVLAQRWKVEAQAQRIGAARAAFYPNIDLLAFAGFQSFSFQNLLHSDSRTYGVGPAVTLPIFDAGRLRSNLRGESSAYTEAVARYNQTLVSALGEIAGKVSQLRSLQGQQEKTALGLEIAEEAYQLEDLRYRQSLTDFLHVLDAQTRVLDIQMQLAKLHTAVLQNHAGLLQALGGVWDGANNANTTIAGTSHD